MKNNLVLLSLFASASVGGIFLASSATHASPRAEPGRLIVQRSPDFGTNLVIRLSIDGLKIANVPRNQHYGGYLQAGHHLLTVLALPNTQQRLPTSVAVNIKSGHTYIFTAAWESDRLVLRASNYYMPTERVPSPR
jgi:hypothetical protein